MSVTPGQATDQARARSGGDADGQTPAPAPGRRARSRLELLSPSRISTVYLLIAIIIIFSIWLPRLFPTTRTAEQVPDTYAITALAALALVIPLSAGIFDISVPYTMSLGGILSAWFLVQANLPLPVAIIAALVISMAVGVVNSFVIVVLRVPSLIATLATGSLVDAVNSFVTNYTPITGGKLGGDYAAIGQQQIGPVTLPVLYAVVAALAIWYLQSHTATGRRLFAVGFNEGAARLAGVRTDKLITGSLLTSSFIAGLAGVVLASVNASGAPTAGTSYLLPAFAGVFLGATQFQPGRFNAWGTIIAVVMIGTGVTGLQLANTPQWAGSLFTGVVLIVALGVTRRQQFRGGGGQLWRRLRRRGKSVAAVGA